MPTKSLIGERDGDQTGSRISITLSPNQVNQVLKAAARDEFPTLAGLLFETARKTRSRRPEPRAAPQAKRRGRGRPPAKRYPPLPGVPDDPRFSQSLIRGLMMLTCFPPDGGTRGVVEVAHELQMNPSTAHRYAVTLVELGLLERTPVDRKYRLAL